MGHDSRHFIFGSLFKYTYIFTFTVRYYQELSNTTATKNHLIYKLHPLLISTLAWVKKNKKFMVDRMKIKISSEHRNDIKGSETDVREFKCMKLSSGDLAMNPMTGTLLIRH